MSQLYYDQSCMKLLSSSLYPDIYLTTSNGHGRLVSAHRVVLVSVSHKFEEILKNFNDTEPLIVRNIKFDILEKIIILVYRGSVDIEDTLEEEDVWDGLHMLRMMDHNMGIIYGIFNSHSITKEHISGDNMEDRTMKSSWLKDDKIEVEDMILRNDAEGLVNEVIQKNPVVNLKKMKTSSMLNDKPLKLLSYVDASKTLKVIKCDLCCHEGFAHKSGLCGHQRKVHGGNRKLKRDNNIKSKTFSCDVCQDAFKYWKSLSQHNRKKHGIIPPTKKFGRDNDVESKIFTCDVCLVPFKLFPSLRRHKSIKHGIITGTENNSPKCQIVQDNCMIKNIKGGDTKDVMVKHRSCHINDNKNETNNLSIDSINNNMSSQDVDGRRSKKNNANILKVHGGNRKFKRDNNVKSKTFSCDVCQAAFKYWKSLRQHNRKKHGIIPTTRKFGRDNDVESKIFTCDVCLVPFKFFPSLRRHQSIKHGIITGTENNSPKCQIVQDNSMIKNMKGGDTKDVMVKHRSCHINDNKSETNNVSKDSMNNNISSQNAYGRRNKKNNANILNDQVSNCNEECEGKSDDDQVVCLFCEISFKSKKGQLNHHLKHHRRQWVLLKDQIINER